MTAIMDLLAGGAELRHVSNSKGGEYHGPCPVCGGNDRFHVWPDQPGGAAAQEAGQTGTWWCRRCDKGGDIIALVMAIDGCDFKTACRRLQIESKAPAPRRLTPLKKKTEWQPQTWPLPALIWRKQAGRLAEKAHQAILNCQPALEYLSRRGLPLAAIERYFLGNLDGEDKTGRGLYRARAAFGLADRIDKAGKAHRSLWIPRGITIPMWAPPARTPGEPQALRIRIRRRTGDLKSDDSKYLVVEGSSSAPLILTPEGIAPDLAVWVVVEAELDAMAVHHACARGVGTLAVLTNRGKPDTDAHYLLARSPLILVALDFDTAGLQGWQWWQDHYSQARRWPVPEGKDPGDYAASGNNLADWIDAALPSALALPPVCHPPEAKREQQSDSPIMPESAPELEALLESAADIKSYVVTLTSGSEFHVTDDHKSWDALTAAGEIVFSRNELARLNEAIGGMDEAARLAAMEKMLDVKRVFAGSYIRTGRSASQMRNCNGNHL
ncbi:MAG: toprim domain-containing protein [Desulfobulbaceae bacterium]|jgi:hypothetical protein|nr:toprim domain-containing protein [Desulfobulbaceae bacterium]